MFVFVVLVCEIVLIGDVVYLCNLVFDYLVFV